MGTLIRKNRGVGVEQKVAKTLGGDFFSTDGIAGVPRGKIVLGWWLPGASSPWRMSSAKNA